MKKTLSYLIVLTLIASLFGCNAKKVEVAQNTEAKESKKFVVGFDAEYPPFGYLADDGKTYVGFDLELAKEVCARTGMEYVPQPIDWDSKDLELNSGKIDCIWSGFTINGRENDYAWTCPYVDNSIVLIVKTDSGIKTKADLAGKVVIVQAASSGLAALEDESNNDFVATFKSLEQCADYNTAFMNLETGVVDCVAVDIGVAKYQLSKKNGVFSMLDEAVSSEQYGIGFKKGNTELAKLVEDTLKEMYKDGTVMKIANNYVDFALPDTVCLGDYVK